MARRSRFGVLLAVGAVLGGCGGDDAAVSHDGGSDAAAPADTGGGEGACTSDESCGDGVFCNGVELCLPGDPSADRRGCVLALAFDCDDGIVCTVDSCDEDMRHCVH